MTNVRVCLCVGSTLLVQACSSAVLASTPPPPPSPPSPTTPTPAQAKAEIDTSPLVVEGVVNTTPGELWKVFSTAEGFKAFGVAHCDIDFRVGGLIRTHYDPKGTLGDEGTIHNSILAYEPERMLAFRISRPPRGFPFPESVWSGTWSVATLTDLGDGRTHLRLTGLGYTEHPESQKMRDFFKAGNAYSLKRLQAVFDKAAAAPTSPAHAADPLAPVVVSTFVAAPASEVYRTLTTSAGWKAFLGVESRIEPAPGGPFEIYFSMEPPAGTRGSEGCLVQAVLPDRMLAFSWNAPPAFTFARTKRTGVVITLDPVSSARTRVTLTNLGYAELAKAHPDHASEFVQTRVYFTHAWSRVLAKLESHFASSAAPGAANP